METNLLILRSKEDAKILASDLKNIGLNSSIFPIFELIELTPILPRISDFSYIITSSKNGIRSIAKKFPDRDVCMYVVGEGSAEEAYLNGFTNIRVGNNNIIELCKKIKSDLSQKSTNLLYVCGVNQKYDVVKALSIHGHNVEKLVLYDLIPISCLSQGVLKKIENGIINGVIFFSPRSVAVFSELLKKTGKGKLTEQLRAFCISRDIAKEVNRLNWKMSYVSSTSSKNSLIELLNYLHN